MNKKPKGMYVDKSLFIESLEQLRLYQDSLIVLYEECVDLNESDEVLEDVQLQIETIGAMLNNLERSAMEPIIDDNDGKPPTFH